MTGEAGRPPEVGSTALQRSRSVSHERHAPGKGRIPVNSARVGAQFDGSISRLYRPPRTDGPSALGRVVLVSRDDLYATFAGIYRRLLWRCSEMRIVPQR